MTRKNLDIKIYIEHLQEIGKVAIHDENIEELQAALRLEGYETCFDSSKDCLVLDSETEEN